jgi:serine/threonine protein phosphatase PrpC
MPLCSTIFLFVIVACLLLYFFTDRVNGCLAVSRAFGDHSLKSAGVCSVPYQQHIELTAAHKFLIVGCDGIWVSHFA